MPNTKIKLFLCPMNTLSDLPASCKCAPLGAGFVMDRMMGLQQSFAGAFLPVA